jgi:signal transduction histidine kinase
VQERGRWAVEVATLRGQLVHSGWEALVQQLDDRGGTVDDARTIDITEVKDNILKGKKVVYERNIKSTGHDDRWYNITFHPVSGAQNEVLGIIMEIENITARKKSELELNRSFNLLNEQNKRLLNFSYIISHNLRSHTSNIKSILTFLEEAENENEKIEMMEHLKNVSNSLDETIHNLNDVVSINNSVNLIHRPLFLIEFISKATDVLKDQIIQKRAVIDNKLLIDASVNFNPAFLESILLNFLSNAIKYSHPDRRPVITLDSYTDNGQFVLIIADNGIGIDLEKNGDKLFGFYKTFNGNSDARGLGLFICKNQVEYMGGKIEVESELGRGTTFKIFFK